MSTVAPSTRDILKEISHLPKDWHGAGGLNDAVLRQISLLPPARYSVETGTGKSTILLSHLSSHHTVFTQDDSGFGDSLSKVRSSPLLGNNVSFVVGPTQVTLQLHKFTSPIEIALIDGPHGYPFPELEYYFIYPHIVEGGYLIVDDTHIPTVTRLVEFLRDDDMFSLETVVRTTAFFKRTSAPTFDPTGDGWWLQKFNSQRFPDLNITKLGIERFKFLLPPSVQKTLAHLVERARSRRHERNGSF